MKPVRVEFGHFEFCWDPEDCSEIQDVCTCIHHRPTFRHVSYSCDPACWVTASAALKDQQNLEHQGHIQGSPLEASWRNLIHLPTQKAVLPRKWQPLFVIKRTTLIGWTSSHFRGAFCLTPSQTLNANWAKNRCGVDSESTLKHTLNCCSVAIIHAQYWCDMSLAVHLGTKGRHVTCYTFYHTATTCQSGTEGRHVTCYTFHHTVTMCHLLVSSTEQCVKRWHGLCQNTFATF